jgi:hypothetical protein
MATRSPEAENEKFGVDAALNKKGFAEFLTKHPDAATFDVADEEGIKKRFEVFEKMQKVSIELKDLYKGKIQEEMGITLDAKDLASIDTHLEEMALENPERLKAISNGIDHYKALPGQIKDLEGEIKKMGNIENIETLRAELQKDAANFEAAGDYVGKVGRLKLYYHTVRRFFNREYNGIDDLDAKKKAVAALDKRYPKSAKQAPEQMAEVVKERLSEAERHLEIISYARDKITRGEAVFKGLRTEIFAGIGEISGLKQAIERKVKEELDSLITKTDVKSLERAAKRHKELSEVRDATETGVDPHASMNADAYKQQIEDGLKLKMSNEVLDKVNKARLGSDALSKLEKSLEDTLKRTAVGAKEGADARQFIVDRLEEAAWQMGQKTDAEGKAKHLIINRIIIKYKAKLYEQ